MILRRLQKGQSIIEFALILPLFLLLVMGIFFFGAVMADYLALNSIARSSAREAAITTNKAEIEKGYPKIIKKYEDYELPIAVFEWNPNKDIVITLQKGNGNDEVNNVTVNVQAKLSKEGTAFAEIVEGLTNKTHSDLKLNVTYTMCSEYKEKGGK